MVPETTNLLVGEACGPTLAARAGNGRPKKPSNCWLRCKSRRPGDRRLGAGFRCPVTTHCGNKRGRYACAAQGCVGSHLGWSHTGVAGSNRCTYWVPWWRRPEPVLIARDLLRSARPSARRWGAPPGLAQGPPAGGTGPGPLALPLLVWREGHTWFARGIRVRWDGFCRFRLNRTVTFSERTHLIAR